MLCNLQILLVMFVKIKLGMTLCKTRFLSIKETIDNSIIFYNKSFGSISCIPLGSRFSVIVARRVYKKIGDYVIKQKNIKNYNNAGKICSSISKNNSNLFIFF